MRFSRKDPMERGAAQPGREGRGAGRMAWLAVAAGAECVFRARTLWNGARVSRVGMVGVRTGRRGWRLPRARNAIFAQGPYGTGCGSAGPGGSGGGPEGVAGGCGGCGMRFSRKDPMERGAAQPGREGRGGGPDGVAGGCGGVQNTIFAQGPYAGAGTGIPPGGEAEGAVSRAEPSPSSLRASTSPAKRGRGEDGR
jgi:hypothetical protein